MTQEQLPKETLVDSELDLDELYCQTGAFLDDSLCICIGMADLNVEDATKLRDWLNEVLSK